LGRGYSFAVLAGSIHHGENVIESFVKGMPYPHNCVKEQYSEE
jgi:hypothetical protein